MLGREQVESFCELCQVCDSPLFHRTTAALSTVCDSLLMGTDLPQLAPMARFSFMMGRQETQRVEERGR